MRVLSRLLGVAVAVLAETERLKDRPLKIKPDDPQKTAITAHNKEVERKRQERKAKKAKDTQ